MSTWIFENIGTIVITLLLALTVFFIIRGMILGRKQGKTSCGGSCAHCSMCSSCPHKS